MKLQKEEKKKLKEFEKQLKHGFSDYTLLKRALMHKSYANENRLPATEHNERYEYLGDAVLELCISHLLVKRFETHPEGELSKLRAAIVNERMLADIAATINLGEYMYMGKGEDQTGGRLKPSLLADALEAVIGAIYLDRGFKKAFGMVERLFKDAIEEVGDTGYAQDYKTRLQELSQGKFHTIPKYKLAGETGPDHDKTFEIKLFIGNELYGVGRGKNKKAAEQDAARVALERLDKKP